jgi:hypothetical protein
MEMAGFHKANVAFSLAVEQHVMCNGQSQRGVQRKEWTKLSRRETASSFSKRVEGSAIRRPLGRKAPRVCTIASFVRRTNERNMADNGDLLSELATFSVTVSDSLLPKCKFSC